MNSCNNLGFKSFEMNTYGICVHKPFRMNTYKKGGGRVIMVNSSVPAKLRPNTHKELSHV